MPNLQKVANKLFQVGCHKCSDEADHLTHNLTIQRRAGEVFAVAKKPQTAPQQEAQQQACVECLPKVERPVRASRNPMAAQVYAPENAMCRMARPEPAVFKSTNQSVYTAKFRKPQFFETIPDAPKQDRNLSHIKFGTAIADGPMDDIYQSSNQKCHGYVHSGVPIGYGNPEIASMHSNYVHHGKFQKKAQIARVPCGVH